jgi:hypothetical protein
MRSTRFTVALTVVLGIVLYAVPAAAQDRVYESALESGDLTTLIPEPFADAEMMSGMDFEAALGPPQVDTPDGAAARAELLGIIEAAGLAPADAMTISGFTGDAQAFMSFGASRIPGVAAADWFELLYRLSTYRSYMEPVREIITVGPKQVLRISDRGSDRSDLLYAQGEILWQFSGDDELGVTFLEGLATIDGPALLADPGALVDGEPVAVIGTADDPLSQVPPDIRGAATTTQTFPVAAVFEGVDPSDADDVETAEALRALLDGVGGVDRATIISSQAIGDDGDGISILGLNVDGADQATFADGFVDLFLLSEFDDPEREETQLGGKAVVRVSEADSGFGQTAYVYGVGGTAWILRGQDEYIAALLRTMP